ncbi:MAG TPA: Smr/MutS family protein [bacterium]
MEDFEKTNDDDDEEIPEYYIVTDVLDLHGFFPEQVPEMVEAFIDNAIELRLTRLRIIHGKGKSKLKHVVRKELEKNPHVAEFGDAPPEIGGWGATIVLLKGPD